MEVAESDFLEIENSIMKYLDSQGINKIIPRADDLSRSNIAVHQRKSSV
jgi:hypothetical protein